MSYLTFNAAAQRRQIQQQATFLARYHAGLPSRNGPGTRANATVFVMPPRGNAHAHPPRFYVPVQFAEQVMQVARQPIARSERNLRVAGKVDGRPFDREFKYEGSRHFHGSTPLPELTAAAIDALTRWPGSAEGTLRTRGSRQDHAHPDKTFSFKRQGNVLHIEALHRKNSDMKIYADGRIYLGSGLVTEDSFPSVRRRVASRLNAAVNFSQACAQAVEAGPHDVAVQTTPSKGDDRQPRVDRPATRDVEVQVGQPAALPGPAASRR